MSDDFTSGGGGAGDGGGDLNVDTGGDSSGSTGLDSGGDLASDVGTDLAGDTDTDARNDSGSDAGEDFGASADTETENDDLGEDLNAAANDNVSNEAVDSNNFSDDVSEDLNSGDPDGDIDDSDDQNTGDDDTQGSQTTDSGGTGDVPEDLNSGKAIADSSDDFGASADTKTGNDDLGEDLNAVANDNISNEAVDSDKFSDNVGEDLNSADPDGDIDDSDDQNTGDDDTQGAETTDSGGAGDVPEDVNGGETVPDNTDFADLNAGDSDTQGGETTDSGGAGDVPQDVNSGETVSDNTDSADLNAGESDTQGGETTDSGGAGDVPEDVDSGGEAIADNDQSKSKEEGNLGGDNALYKTDVGSETPKVHDVDVLSKMSDEERKAYSDIIAKEPAITNDVKSVAELSGGELQGLEHRLKTPSSVYEKLHERGESVTMGDLNDVIRYTEIHSQDSLANGTNISLNEYATKGYSVDKVKNSWLDEDATYRGINATLTSPDGQSFEVQYHTQESFDLKNGELHTLYNERRVLPDDNERAIELDAKMREMSSKLTVPSNIESVNKK